MTTRLPCYCRGQEDDRVFPDSWVDVMKNLKLVLIAVAAAVALPLSTGVQAFDCPNRFNAAQSAIDKVTADMKGMKDKMSKAQHALVHSLIDDAKMMLAGAKHNYEKPQGAYDHARSVAKATAALGHAEAADILHQKYMK